ncbi:ATP-binding protein [Haliangium ochraceum]|uniref:histidine kinase n=1 Tax=Haliangium ochraceum (strain DSM 14365 / JCM 11303 / SMP-2) TaxID=502025 RepID=D0LYI0_HALO1|nr:ATP-binding protein [Haliangium ochraceum]ACY17846.1 multi-sensor signal transduction histidine kinase [Haliangium ochraceum DSM 14365]
MTSGAPFGRNRILLIEDNQDDHILVDAFLPEGAYTITWCQTAREARRQLGTQRFDLVLLDHGLPDSNGLSFLEELRVAHPESPVIVLTGRNDQALAVSALKMGAHTYLLKDEIPEHLAEAVAEALPCRTPSPVDKRPDSKPKFVDTAERFYQIFMESVDEGCLVVDQSGDITFANRAFETMVRRDVQSPGRSVYDLFTPESAGRLRASLWRLSTAQSSTSVVMEATLNASYARRSGELTTVRIAMRGQHDRDGSYQAGLLILTDISEVLHAKQLLAERYMYEKAQHNQLRAILESSRDGIILIDRSLRLRVVNGPMARLLGLAEGAEYWIGKSLVELTLTLRHRSPELTQAVLSEVRRISTGDESSNTGEATVGQRALRWLDLPVQGDDSRLVAMQDVTAEQTVQQMRDDLVHMAVHDLRNPLGVIRQSFEQVREILTDDAEPAPLPAIGPASWNDALAWLDLGREGTSQMLRLVTAILDAHRLDTGQMPLQRSACSLAELVQRVVHAQTPIANAREVRIAARELTPGAHGWIDVSLIERVLQNLLDNAIRSSPPGGTVRVSAQPWPGDEAYHCLVVADEGGGISPALQERLFQRFATGRRQGVGLGLAFCKLAVEAHGGRIWVESKPEQGATFRFLVPAQRD